MGTSRAGSEAQEGWPSIIGARSITETTDRGARLGGRKGRPGGVGGLRGPRHVEEVEVTGEVDRASGERVGQEAERWQRPEFTTTDRVHSLAPHLLPMGPEADTFTWLTALPGL